MIDQAIQTQGEPSYLQMSAQTLEKQQESRVTLGQWEPQLDWERQHREEVEHKFKENQRELHEMQLQLQEREKLAGKYIYLCV